MPGTFFTSWELWQEMTFVLAMAIVAVFGLGLGKLWWNNRLMKKQEVLDEEKRARVEEMRKTGLPMKRANTVPFGVRAIQSGIEVDGIWISRPASLHEGASAKLASSTTLAGRDSDSQKKGREYSEDEKSVLVSTASLGTKRSQSAATILQKLTDSDSTKSAQSVAPPLSKFAHKPRRQSSRPARALNEDTLRKLEGHSPAKPSSEPYPPTTSAQRNPRRPSQRSTASSSAESVDSRPPSVRSTSGRSYTSSSHSSRLYMARNPHANRPGHDPALRRWSEKEGGDPFETPARTPSGFSALSRAETQASQYQGQEMPPPEPTFGPGDAHFSRVPRRINDGFDFFPTGTFGETSVEGERTGESEQSRGAPRNHKRLPKIPKQPEEQEGGN